MFEVSKVFTPCSYLISARETREDADGLGVLTRILHARRPLSRRGANVAN